MKNKYFRELTLTFVAGILCGLAVMLLLQPNYKATEASWATFYGEF